MSTPVTEADAQHRPPPPAPLPDRLARALGGKFIVFEGPDGSGKSTQLRRFVQAAAGAAVRLIEVREPGGTEIGEKIREALLDHLEEDMSVRCEMLLYMASRAQLVEQCIRPALADGCLVVADRFVSSTLAYQGTAGGLPKGDILDAARIACGRTMPDLVVVFDVDEDTAANRLNPLLDRMEAKGRAFHRRVRQGYLDQIAADPDHYARVDATESEDAVFERLVETVAARLT